MPLVISQNGTTQRPLDRPLLGHLHCGSPRSCRAVSDQTEDTPAPPAGQVPRIPRLRAIASRLLIWRSRRRERRQRAAAALLPGGLALAGFLLSAIVGHNTLLSRNLLPIWLPAAIFLAAGLGAARARLLGIGASVVLCAIGITAVISVDTTFAFQRPKWQLVADELGTWPRHVASAESDRPNHRGRGQHNPCTAARPLPEGPAIHQAAQADPDRRGRCRGRVATQGSRRLLLVGVRNATSCRRSWIGGTSFQDSGWSPAGVYVTSASSRCARPNPPRCLRKELPAAGAREQRHFIPSGPGQHDAQLVERS